MFISFTIFGRGLRFSSSESLYFVCRFGSWTYQGNIVDVVEPENNDVVGYYNEACPSVVQSVETTRNAQVYDCCPDDVYVDITVNMKLAWR